MAKGDTKTNQYLDIAANGTRADLPTGTCCETRSQTLIREVAERIMDVEDEVEEIKNNPDVVDIVATYADLQAYDTQHLTDKDIIRVLQDETHDGESTYYRYNKQSNTWTYVGESKQYDDFVGTDGTTAGTAGLVPAPATTDTDKYLKSDGTWAEVQGGGGGTSNFNQLTNRPSYDNTTMTGSTNIPKVPTATSELTNDSGFITSSALPTVNDATLTITQNGTSKGTFTANDADDTTIALTDTTYSAGTGLDLTGTTFSADTTVLATKTDLDSKQDELTAGDNVTIEDESGALVISATDTTYSNFTGTDGTAAGAAGLVPAPAVTDTDKYLKSDGTWATVQGGGGSAVKTLTAADFNWNFTLNSATEPYDCVALWLLEPGIYQKTVSSGLPVAVHANPGGIETLRAGTYVVAAESADLTTKQILYTTANSSRNWYQQLVTVSNGTSSGTRQFIMDNNVVQTTGTSTTNVMSQKAVTDTIFAENDTGRIKIGTNSGARASSVSIGEGAGQYSAGNTVYSVALGAYSGANLSSGVSYSVALGSYATPTRKGEVNIGTGTTINGYNSTKYRVLGGVHDPQSDHDAATKGYVDPTTGSSAPTTATVGRLGQIQIDTTTATAYMCVAVDTVTPAYTWKQITA